MKTMHRSDWLVRSGTVTKEINVVVTPRVLVSLYQLQVHVMYVKETQSCANLLNCMHR